MTHSLQNNIDICSSTIQITLSETVPGFHNPEKEAFRKHCWNGENAGLKMLETSIFSFAHYVFYRIREKFHHWTSLKLFVNVFNLDKAHTLSSGRGIK